MQDEKKIAIVILNWNGAADTVECLKSVQNIDYPAFAVVVVDNGSTDDSVARLRTAFPSLNLLETGENLGYAEGNNVGIRRALADGADFILVLNNDTVVDSQILRQFAAAAVRYPDAGIFGAKIYYYAQPERLWFAGGEWNRSAGDFVHRGFNVVDADGSYEQEDEVDYATGCALFFRREVVERIGLFDERFFLVFEETDWCYRARRAGFSIRFIPGAKLRHKISVSFGGAESPVYAYFYSRNILLWARRNLPAAERRRVYRRVIGAAWVPHLSEPMRHPFFKRLYWDVRYWLGKKTPVGMARILGVRDFCLGRFGKTPTYIGALARAAKKNAV